MSVAQTSYPVLIQVGKNAAYWQVGPNLFQATRSPTERPAMNGAGYGNLNTIKRLKGD